MFVGPLLLLFVTPVFVNVAALAGLRADSSFLQLWKMYPSLPELLRAAFPLPGWDTVAVLVGFTVFQLVLFVALPGKLYDGARAPSGFVPRFKRNGGPAFLVTAGVFLYYSRVAKFFPAEWIYDHLLQLMTLLNATALTVAVALYLKGLYAPSTPDHGSSENALFRIYWGEELYPSVLGVDLKHFIICRLGMMGWFLFTLSFAFASIRANGGEPCPAMVASVASNALYVAKFFVLFEVPGYVSAADIAVDRVSTPRLLTFLRPLTLPTHHLQQ